MGPSAKIIAELNIRHYRSLLMRETDSSKRQTIATLLAEEEAKLAKLTAQDHDSGSNAGGSTESS